MVAIDIEVAHDALAMIEYRDDPSVLIFGDSDAALERAHRIALLAGCRVAGAEWLEDAADRLNHQAAVDAVLVEIEDEPEPILLTALLDRLQSDAESGTRRSVVSAPAPLTDLIAARTPHPEVSHLVDPSEADRVSALALASRRPTPRLNDIGRGEGSALLQQLSEEVGRIANILASLSEDEVAAQSGPKPLNDCEADESPLDAGFVRSVIRARRLRDQYFRGGMFADPAWDMLLDLMAARLEGNRVAVSSLCIAAAVPATTALRWIKALTDRGLFVRSADPQDGRRVYIELSDEAARTLGAYLRAVQRIATVAI